MTGATSSTGRIFMDFDGNKNKEWLRRRKLRLEQVRKQSSEIAKALRDKVSGNEKLKLEELEKVKEANFRSWKAEKLDELERKFRLALEGFGEGYMLAEAEPDAEDLLEEKNQINLSKALQRGELAQKEELKRNRLAKEKICSPILRKKIVRKKEDLRSALVRTIPIKKQLVYTQKSCDDEAHPEEVKITLMKKNVKDRIGKKEVTDSQKKVHLKRSRKKKVIPHKSCACKCKATLPNHCSFKKTEPVWINLNDVEVSEEDSSLLPKSSKSITSHGKIQKEKSEGTIEFYDFSSRYSCKSFKEFPHLVERIEHSSEKLNARELAETEDDKEKEEAKKKLEDVSLSQERGREALRKEKINKDYNNLISKLEELSKKEKILKSLQRSTSSFLHMNDKRLSERIKAKQKLMDSKFESIYYEATAAAPPTESPKFELVYNVAVTPTGGGDCPEVDEKPSSELILSPSTLKYNTPVISSRELSVKSSTTETSPHSEKKTREQELLTNISETLKKGRALRKSLSRNRNLNDSEETKESSNGEPESTKARSTQFPSEVKVEEKSTKCQESQTENLKIVQMYDEERLKSSNEAEDDSLPASTSTSYKSPPKVMRSYRLQHFLDYLEELSSTEQDNLIAKDSKLKRKINKLLNDFPCENRMGEKEKVPWKSQSLEYYIEKLLDMSRECVANLSVSSECISTPNMSDLDVKNEGLEPEFFRGVSSEEEERRRQRLERADLLENSIKNWKMILEKESRESHPVSEDEVDGPERKFSEATEVEKKDGVKPFCEKCNSEVKSRYDEITKKCSERISELSEMLDKVRKDKEKLLTSTSGGSSINLSKVERSLGREPSSGAEEEENIIPLRVRLGCAENMKSSPVLETFINRYNLTWPREATVSTTAVADSQSPQDTDQSLESWPDVMDELLKKEILSSPFKWSDGEHSLELTPPGHDNQTRPSSIETVIGNFRREINKIRPFALSESFSQSNSPGTARGSPDGSKKRVSCLWLATDNEYPYREESSVESINRHLTSLGLNWAKSFLKKNEESRAMSSSSNSEGKYSEDEKSHF